MDQQASDRTFSNIGTGDIFSTPAHPLNPLMKISGTHAVALGKFSLFNRGDSLAFLPGDRVYLQPEAELSVSLAKQPVGSHQHPWIEGA